MKRCQIELFGKVDVVKMMTAIDKFAVDVRAKRLAPIHCVTPLSKTGFSQIVSPANK